MVRMPAVFPNGTYNPGSGENYYCDANKVRGTFCPEIDLMEANTYAFQATPHNCTNPVNGFYENCDRSGSCF